MALRSFSARFTYTGCEICGEEILEDEQVVYLDDPDAGELVHAQCAADDGYDVV